MKDISQLNTNNLTVETRKTVPFETNSISSLVPNIWNSLPSHLKRSESLVAFQRMIKN